MNCVSQTILQEAIIGKGFSNEFLIENQLLNITQ
jgi:hypothetical protein